MMVTASVGLLFAAACGASVAVKRLREIRAKRLVAEWKKLRPHYSDSWSMLARVAKSGSRTQARLKSIVQILHWIRAESQDDGGRPKTEPQQVLAIAAGGAVRWMPLSA